MSGVSPRPLRYRGRLNRRGRAYVSSVVRRYDLDRTLVARMVSTGVMPLRERDEVRRG